METMTKADRIWGRLPKKHAKMYGTVLLVDETEFKEETLPIIEAELSRWIPVGERLPEEWTMVLTWVFKLNRWFVMFRRKKDWFLPGELCPFKEKVTHWQPLPEPPETK